MLRGREDVKVNCLKEKKPKARRRTRMTCVECRNLNHIRLKLKRER